MVRYVLWKDLPLSKQRQVVDGWINKIIKADYSIDGSFLSLGSGFKQSNNRVSRQLSLRFVVEKKKARINALDRIPKFIPARIKWDGETVETKIPTDIESFDDGDPQVRIYASAILRHRFQLKGVAAALLKDSDDNYFFLSCHHVLAASSKTSNLRGLPTVDVLKNKNSQHVIGNRSKNAAFPHSSHRAAVDASIAKIKSKYIDQVKEAYRNLTFNRKASKVLRKNIRLSNDSVVRIISPRAVIKGRIIGVYKNRPFSYLANGNKVKVYIKEAYVVKTSGSKLSNSRTIKGDSGSAVLYKDVLVGMHFWGNPKKRLSYFIPSHILMSDETFRKELMFVA